MAVTKKAPPIVEKPVIEFEREYVDEDSKRYHVVRFEYKDQSYETKKQVPHGDETLPFSKISNQINRGLSTFQRSLNSVLQKR